jgi:ATP synthase protein I
MSQDSEGGTVHLSRVDADALLADPTAAVPPVARPAIDGRAANPAGNATAAGPAIDPVARTAKRMYQGLSASSAGLELGIAVGIGTLFGNWLDGKLGTGPWLMIVFMILGLIAGFRGVLRAVARAEKAADRG